MSQYEMTHSRGPSPLSYFHRPISLRRFIDESVAEKLYLYDLDGAIFLECDPIGYPIVLFEECRDTNQNKYTKALSNLAKLAQLPAFCAYYTPSSNPNNAYADENILDIESVRVKIIHGFGDNQTGNETEYTKEGYAQFLVDLRDETALAKENQKRLDIVMEMIESFDTATQRKISDEIDKKLRSRFQ